VDLERNELRLPESGKTFALTPLGDVLPILEAGDVFEYAKASGMIQ